jgi:hypothetical protein
MAAKTWSDDFRIDAINASMAMFPGEIPSDIQDCGRSFCLPTRERPMMGFTPGKLMFVFLVLSFALMGLAALTFWCMPTRDPNVF